MNLQLEKLKNFHGRKGPLLFIVMDGIGIGKEYDGNAVFKAITPTFDKFFKSKLYTQLKAHGTAVGLPSDEDMGNSEVGHNAIGAGRIFDQGAKLVNKAFETGEIFRTNIWHNVIDKSKSGGTIHFIGLLSDGNVHSHIKHLFALLERCETEKVKKVSIHILLDGRDVGGRTALNYITPLEEKLKSINLKNNFDYKIASGGGRMITTMDRYNADWSIVERGWKAHVRGIGRNFISATEAINTFYREDENIIDQYLDSFVIVDNEKQPIGKIKDGDSVVFFNFRGDRAIEISKAFEDEKFEYFERVDRPKVYYAGMMQYDGDTLIPKNFLVQPPEIDKTISAYLCAEGVTSFAISETQKYGHVTYFWNGNRSGYINENLEKYIEIKSDKIEFDKAPKMKAEEITEKTIELLRSGNYKFGRLNFPNGDMVGHTGNFDAAVISVEAVDKCVSELLEVVKELNGIAVVTADHGNSDEMYKIKNGEKIIITSHSLNPVPFVIYDPNYKSEYNIKDLPDSGLTNITGTLLNLLGFKNVENYDDSLIKFG
ncbi:MAG: 2,3-bisphosphoglycerate-independent phosphoglycerate mutase [Ignavibacteriales bacterium CG_4_9_14_3_um_filter_30_11]|nr:2,3-bisphosphoglycerate-independent phosphoglycerate mutase [Ignavibacteria bacterium]PJA97744.1 MAG: 2,3-bisphosphoglycerate-independent phosphoglycerate mutase [Ignavibacteriales bacterium CG_4_9_14_3_um_filter_30_11]